MAPPPQGSALSIAPPTAPPVPRRSSAGPAHSFSSPGPHYLSLLPPRHGGQLPFEPGWSCRSAACGVVWSLAPEAGKRPRPLTPFCGPHGMEGSGTGKSPPAGEGYSCPGLRTRWGRGPRGVVAEVMQSPPGVTKLERGRRRRLMAVGTCSRKALRGCAPSTRA